MGLIKIKDNDNRSTCTFHGLGWMVLVLVLAAFLILVMGQDGFAQVYVSYIMLTSSNPTDASVVGFKVSFSLPVVGVDASDFSLTTTGSIDDASVQSVSPINGTPGENQHYKVSVKTGSGDGTIRLNLIDDDSIRHIEYIVIDKPPYVIDQTYYLGGPGLGNGNYSSGAYTIDKSAPQIGTVTCDSAPCGGETKDDKQLVFRWSGFSDSDPGSGISHYEVAFGSNSNHEAYKPFESVGLVTSKTLVPGDFGSSVFPEGVFPEDEYVFTVRAVNGAGKESDVSCNITIKVPPFVSSIDLADPDPTCSPNVRFTVTFSETVSGVDASDFSLTTSGSISGASVQSVSPTAGEKQYTVSVNAGSGDGTISLNVIDDDSIKDDNHNPLGGTGTNNGNYTGVVEYTIISPPVVSSIEISDTNPTDSSNVSFWVTFSEEVTGVNTTELSDDFTLNLLSDDITGMTYISSVDRISTKTYLVAVNTGVVDNKIGLIVKDNDSIKSSTSEFPLGCEGEGNGDFTGEDMYIIDKTPPQKGIVSSATGPYSIDNKKLVINWTDFSEEYPFEVGVVDYEIAFGNESDPEAYKPFFPIGPVATWTFYPSDLPGSQTEFPNGSKYVCSVRAKNSLGHISESVSCTVTVDTTAFLLGDEIPLPEGKEWDDIDWTNTTFTPTHVIKIDHIRKLLTGDYGIFSIDWKYMDGGGFSRAYQASSETVKDPMIIYSTYTGNTATRMPEVDLSGITKVTIHYNSRIPEVEYDPMDPPDNRILWKDERDYLQARSGVIELGNPDNPALIVLQYDKSLNPAGPDDFIGIEIVEVKTHEVPDVQMGEVHIGSRLHPCQPVDWPVEAVITKGGADAEGGAFIYKHTVTYLGQKAEQYGQLWAIRENPEKQKMEVVWTRKGLGDVVWPFQLRQYTANWPEEYKDKYQRYVRGHEPLGIEVTIPSLLNPDLINQKFDTQGHHAHLNNDIFSADGPGWVLLKYQTGPPEAAGLDWIGFEVVRCLSRTDSTVFDLNPVQWDIGTEIRDDYHEGQWPDAPGYIYIKKDDSEQYAGDKYGPAIYEETGQIFAVNEDILEIWWYNLSRAEDPEGSEYPLWPSQKILWPSEVKRYQAVWPSSPEEIIIARQNGTGLIKESIYGTDWAIYFQNDDTLPGFNPNDEHAMKSQYESGWAIFALRDDLGTPETSIPYVLMKYKEQPDNNLWRFRVLKVVREKSPYFFRDWAGFERPEDPYEGVVGLLIQPPFPLSILEYCDETYAVSGPYFEDKNGNHWVKAAGDDGMSSADIFMRYYYPIQPGFFPDEAHGGPSVGSHVPWLDNGTGIPVDVTYTVTWPDSVPEMKIGETLIEAMRGLPTIDGQCSVDIIYQQSLVYGLYGAGGSVILIDPVQTRQVELTSIPEDIITEQRSGTERIFPDLSLALRLRVSYDSQNQMLKFKGLHIDPTVGYDYALLNVMSERERDELLALSGGSNWQIAVNNLYNTSKDPVTIVDSSVDPYDMLALTSGFAQGVGYVTLAMQNAEQCKDLPVSLEVIKVIPELDSGEIIVITPQCPFDESLTLRHKGDFGGRTDDYLFEWQYLPDEDGTDPNNVPYDSWLTFTPKPSGIGAVDITIKGPGLLTLSDNWFICRYKYIGEDLPYAGIWSEWTKPQLAMGWIKRVVGDINPFTQRATGGGIEGAENNFFSYEDREVNTVVSMISQAGPPWMGNVPMNCTNLDDFGLLQIYETVFGRGIGFSIDGLPPVDYPPANTALLLVASRIADLYMLLGNEAYADAADPTIAFGTDDGLYGAEASSIHCFMNVTGSLLEEELALLRGRDDSLAPGVQEYPFYNHLIWNFTNDFTGGEAAYALNYNIQDENGDAAGQINETDAKALYPQGHGDTWGHYLTAIKTYYRLLIHPNYTWNCRSEAVLVGGVPVTVDYLDERKFAKAAAAKARAGSEIVNLSYRSAYLEDPAGQWNGYRDSDPERAWGLSEWSSRTGLGTYIDWVVGNAILPPEDKNPEHTGIQKIDRTTILELREVASRFQEIQSQVDMADVGLNPLGLATNVVPFDISPTEIDQGKTHFEQIYERAVVAMNNAITVFNHATNSTQLLRRQADRQTEFEQAVEDREADFKSRLIEVFGYPYEDDIGPGQTYPTGYDGPDIYHYSYIDPSELLGVDIPEPEAGVLEIPLTVTSFDVLDDGSLGPTEKEVIFHISTSADRFGCVKPEEWTGERRAPGEIQMARSELIQARIRFERTLAEYDSLIKEIEDQAKLIEAQHNLDAEEIKVLNEQYNTQVSLFEEIKISREKQLTFKRNAHIATLTANAISEQLPTSTGMSPDVTAIFRGAFQLEGISVIGILTRDADHESLIELDHQQALQDMQARTNIVLTTIRNEFAIQQQVKLLEQAVHREISLRFELYTLQEAMHQASGRYMASLARGYRLREDRSRFRRQTAAKIQSYRYKDMAFRIFRNDALQKYRAQFDMAARYVYLAAKAYDYETTFLSEDSRAGQQFLTDIVRARLIGNIQGGQPLTGKGLADPMACMLNNFQVLKPQLGFNNPQKETNRFSLRHELFRILLGFQGNDLWRETLWRHVVPNLLDLPEFQRYAIPFYPRELVEPAIVIPFESCIEFGKNFFNNDLGAYDSAYDSTKFTTKVRSVGVWFSNYNTLGMANTPHVYLIPVGADIQRSPNGDRGEFREFTVLDQKLSVPFGIIGGDLDEPAWIPRVDTISDPDTFAAIKRYSSFRAYHDSGTFNEAEVIRNSQLIGRSVWNTRWLLIIPAGWLHSDREEGLNRFIDGALIGNGDERDGNGITDIKIIFETYAYSGN